MKGIKLALIAMLAAVECFLFAVICFAIWSLESPNDRWILAGLYEVLFALRLRDYLRDL